MPISGEGWELLVRRSHEERRGRRWRTVGAYQVHHAGRPMAGLSGTTYECRGPGDNAVAGNRRRIEAGRYPLATWDGERYVTFGYRPESGPRVLPRPGLELRRTANRTEILIHPGRGFLWSTGCINLGGDGGMMDFADSRGRVIALIEDLRGWLGGAFPLRNGVAIAGASVMIEGEPEAASTRPGRPIKFAYRARAESVVE